MMSLEQNIKRSQVKVRYYYMNYLKIGLTQMVVSRLLMNKIDYQIWDLFWNNCSKDSLLT